MSPERVFLDESRLTQILLNLVGNAVKFTETGSIQISMNATDDMLQIDIKDTGIGIASDIEASIFEPFTQVENKKTRKREGTGLGLFICKQLVLMMKGTIILKTNLKRGTHVTVNIPILKPPTMILTKKDNLDIEQTNLCLIKPLLILVAEDSKTNQMVIKLILEKLGHKVVVVNNGQEAMEILSYGRVRFDLVLMDVSMPIMCGIEATKILRLKGHQIPIIALTGNARNEDRQQCIEAGMNDVVTKPIRAASLNRALQNILPANK